MKLSRLLLICSSKQSLLRRVRRGRPKLTYKYKHNLQECHTFCLRIGVDTSTEFAICLNTPCPVNKFLNRPWVKVPLSGTVVPRVQAEALNVSVTTVFVSQEDKVWKLRAHKKTVMRFSCDDHSPHKDERLVAYNSKFCGMQDYEGSARY